MKIEQGSDRNQTQIKQEWNGILR